jgi:hypothetical protein
VRHKNSHLKNFKKKFLANFFCLVHKKSKKLASLKFPQMGNFPKGYLFIANFFDTQIIGGAKELVVLL